MLKKRTKICHLSLSSTNNFVLSIYLAKITSWVTFFMVSNIIFDFGRLFSLLTEAAQVIQNKKKTSTLGVPGGIKFIWTSPLRQCCKLQQRFPSQIGKKCLQSCTKKNLVRKYCSKNFLNEVHFLNKFYKTKFSKINAMFKNINI